MAFLYGVIYTAGDGMTTKHSAHLTRDDAACAGAELARSEWDIMMADEPEENRKPFPDDLDDWDAVDALRSEFSVSLEIEEIEIATETVLSLAARVV